jgi:hypothetical protein
MCTEILLNHFKPEFSDELFGYGICYNSMPIIIYFVTLNNNIITSEHIYSLLINDTSTLDYLLNNITDTEYKKLDFNKMAVIAMISPYENANLMTYLKTRFPDKIDFGSVKNIKDCILTHSNYKLDFYRYFYKLYPEILDEIWYDWIFFYNFLESFSEWIIEDEVLKLYFSNINNTRLYNIWRENSSESSPEAMFKKMGIYDKMVYDLFGIEYFKLLI